MESRHGANALKVKMALRTVSPVQLFHKNVLFLFAGGTVSQVRYRNHRDMPQKKKKNPFVKRHTDFIKHLSIALVKHERVCTTARKAEQLRQYGDLLINLTQRRQPPPDLYMIKNGFVITEEEAIESRTRRRITNRMSKKSFIPPKELPEVEYVEKCKSVVKDILLQDKEAIEKLYGPLANRFQGRYGGFVKITNIPLPKKRLFPALAFVEFVENELKPLPEMPTIVKGRLKAFPRANICLNQTEMIPEVIA